MTLRQVELFFALQNRPFFTYMAAIIHIEFIRFKDGMPRGQSISICAHFLGKKRTAMYISPEEGDHYYIKTCHNDLFSNHNYFFLGELKKNWPEKRA